VALKRTDPKGGGEGFQEVYEEGRRGCFTREATKRQWGVVGGNAGRKVRLKDKEAFGEALKGTTNSDKTKNLERRIRFPEIP